MSLTLQPTGKIPGKLVRTPLDEISQDVKDAVEEAYVYCQTNEDSLTVKVANNKAEADAWLKEARSYAYAREAGRVVVYGNGVKSGNVNFRVEDPKTAE